MGGADYSIARYFAARLGAHLIGFYEAHEIVGFDRFLHVQVWLDRGLARPGVNSAVSRAGLLFAIALLGGVLQAGWS